MEDIPKIRSQKGMDEKYLKRVLEKFPTIQKDMKGRYEEIELVAFIDVLAVFADGKLHISGGKMCKPILPNGMDFSNDKKIKLIDEFSKKWTELRND
jgi:hypothetical protein